MKNFILDIFRQIAGWNKPRQGFICPTYHAVCKMHEYGLDIETVNDAFRYGEEVKENMIIRKYANYQVGMYIREEPQDNKYDKVYMITTVWKKPNW